MNNLLDFFSSAIFSNSISNLFIPDKQIINSKIGNEKIRNSTIGNEKISVWNVHDYEWSSTFFGFGRSIQTTFNSYSVVPCMFIANKNDTFIITSDLQAVNVKDIINVGFSIEKIPNRFFGHSYSYQPYINIVGSGTLEYKIHNRTFDNIITCDNFVHRVQKIQQSIQSIHKPQ